MPYFIGILKVVILPLLSVISISYVLTSERSTRKIPPGPAILRISRLDIGLIRRFHGIIPAS